MINFWIPGYFEGRMSFPWKMGYYTFKVRDLRRKRLETVEDGWKIPCLTSVGRKSWSIDAEGVGGGAATVRFCVHRHAFDHTNAPICRMKARRFSLVATWEIIFSTFHVYFFRFSIFHANFSIPKLFVKTPKLLDPWTPRKSARFFGKPESLSLEIRVNSKAVFWTELQFYYFQFLEVSETLRPNFHREDRDLNF